MAKKKDYSNWSKDELLKEIDALRKQKTYGLVWERDQVKEKFDYFINWEGVQNKEVFKEAIGKFPVLKEVKGKDITTDKEEGYNILIEGDNYHSLAVLNFTHNKSVDVCYIDPPYNTGNKDFKYNDQYVDVEDGYRHSKWLSFMEKRLKLGRELLKETGIIFISIDDNEQAQLKILCDEIFGGDNFISLFPRLTKKGGKSSEDISKNHDYILVYSKTNKAKFKRLEHTDSGFKFKDEFFEERGLYKLNQTLDYDSIQYSKSLDYEIKLNGMSILPGGVNKEEMEKRQKKNPDRDFCWRWSKNLFEFGLKNGFIVLKDYKDKPPRIYTKTYQNATISQDERGNYFVEILPRTKSISSIDFLENEYSNDSAKKELKNIFGSVIFDYPKPVNLLKTLFKVSSDKDSLILDFMAGTGTSGQAVLELNKEDHGNRKFILCTNNENNICTDICHPRIDKVIKGYSISANEKIEGLGGNLKYFKTDFVDSAPTDQNKKKIVDKSTEMICIKENAFEPIVEKQSYKIFRNTDHYLGIIFDEENIEDFVKEAKKLKDKINVYVFSLDDSVPEQEFKELKGKAKLCAIPEAILHVYRRVFKDD
jgi:adenine-specific DNA-methyltransferase